MIVRWTDNLLAKRRRAAYGVPSAQEDLPWAYGCDAGVPRRSAPGIGPGVAPKGGGLSSRNYLKNLASSGKVDRWVSLGGQNHSTSSANTCFSTACIEMRVGSTFLANLNSGDETPGIHVRHLAVPCDGIINPVDSTILSGATNTQTACVVHTNLRNDATVYGHVRDFINP